MLSFVITENLNAIMNLAKIPGDHIRLFGNSASEPLATMRIQVLKKIISRAIQPPWKLLLKCPQCVALATRESQSAGRFYLHTNFSY